MVGADQAEATRPPRVGVRNGHDVRYGPVNDGAGRDTLVAYLQETSRVGAGRFAVAPEVRVIGPSNAREMERVTRAVDLVNLALPADYKMTVRAPLPDLTLRGERPGQSLSNTIHVEFVPSGEYDRPNSAAVTFKSPYSLGTRINSAYIQFHRGSNSYTLDHLMAVLLVHELVHALGFGHVNPEFESLMNARVAYHTPFKSLLYPIDREALRALYGHMEIGQPFESLGPWSEISTHLQGQTEHVEYGVALRNGYAEPWASGPSPTRDLSGSGPATWTGTLLGFTPEAAPVAGDAEIAVNLGTLRGRAGFTALEKWAAGAAPGNAGTGVMWGDGDLSYSIAVQGNTFKQTGGDEGVVTGIFTGTNHEGVGGTLERDDLTAAFGGEM